ncbi:hypothetical protein DL96DRAFT_1606458 [Flagelloscypha sp. PMI_526]|nr:hypothetical protein DL96DRAFT_1606458 [Flagelloscypha sp. PMI_526]
MSLSTFFASRARLSRSSLFAMTCRANMSTAASKIPRALPQFSMENKVCVVTGGANGLGYEFCKAFVQSGCTQLAIVDLNVADTVTSTKTLLDFALENLPGAKADDYKIVGVGCDVSNQQNVIEAFDQIKLAFWDRIDAVVASAGIVHNMTAFDYPEDRMKRLYDINVHGAFFTAREAAKTMVRQDPKGGSITLVASMSGHIVNIPQAQTPYNASKAAVKHMAASLGLEWAKMGVRVNTLSPGYMRTKLTDQVLKADPDLKNAWESLTPVGRVGEPHELAGAIVFLASDASSFMTGTDVRVDGGYCII